MSKLQSGALQVSMCRSLGRDLEFIPSCPHRAQPAGNRPVRRRTDTPPESGGEFLKAPL